MRVAQFDRGGGKKIRPQNYCLLSSAPFEVRALRALFRRQYSEPLPRIRRMVGYGIWAPNESGQMSHKIATPARSGWVAANPPGMPAELKAMGAMTSGAFGAFGESSATTMVSVVTGAVRTTAAFGRSVAISGRFRVLTIVAASSFGRARRACARSRPPPPCHH